MGTPTLSKGARLLAVFTAIAVVDSGQLYFGLQYQERAIPWILALRDSLPEWCLWAALTPGILWLGRRVPLTARPWWRPALVHLPVSAVVAAAHMLTVIAVLSIVDPPTEPGLTIGSYFARVFFRWFHVEMLIYWAILGFGTAFDAHRELQARELEASRLEAQLAHARLRALEMQLHPHFLFNTLNAVSALIRTGDAPSAVRMIAGLSELLRLALDRSDAQEVPLREELDFLERYLEIERVRFRDRLRVETAVDPEAMSVPVPNLVLQPLVENAVRHGIARSASAGLVRIEAAREGDALRIRVIDDGPGPSPGVSTADGVGLRNTRARLAQLYGDAHRFELRSAASGGTVAELTLPWRGTPNAHDATEEHDD